MCQAVIPAMKRQKSGRIINAASFAAIIPRIGSAAYAASKAAVVYFTRVLAGELGPCDITVNCYAPGMIPTEMNHFAEAAPERQDDAAQHADASAAGAIPRTSPTSSASSPRTRPSYITGAMIDVSGGKLATQMPWKAYE